MVDYQLEDNYPLLDDDVKKSRLEEIPDPPKPVKRVNRNINIFDKLLKKQEQGKGPFLLLMKENGDDEIIEGIQEGALHIQKKNGRKKTILIKNRKIRSLKYGGDRIKYFNGYENNASLYPEEPRWDSNSFNMYLRKVYLTREDFEKKGFKFDPMFIVVIILVGLAVGAFYLWRTGAFQNILGG